MSSSQIGVTLTSEVDIGSSSYPNSITVTSTGAVIAPRAIYASSSATNADILNNGTIEATTYFVPAGGIGIWAADAPLIVNDGLIDSSYIGILLLNGGSISNRGVIKSDTIGITADGGNLSNTGTISGSTYGLSLSPTASFTNAGQVYGGETGIGLSAGGNISNSGTISGGQNAILASGDLNLTVESGAKFTGSVTDTSDLGHLILAGTTASALDMGTSFSGFNTIDFTSDASWTIEGASSELASGQTINDMKPGDVIVLDGFEANSEVFVDGVGLELSNGQITKTLAIVGSFDTEPFKISIVDGSNTAIVAPCFLAGTRINTIQGQVPVERLNIGDKVKTLSGSYSAIKWIGYRSYNGHFIAENHLALPIRIRRHALGFNVPVRDLYVSPDHAICIDNKLIHAWRLINGVSVSQITSVEFVRYFHVELDSHDIIFAENCPTESFLDVDCRERFENARSWASSLNPSTSPVACLPRLEHGSELYLIQQRIASRAGIPKVPYAHGPLRGFLDEAGPTVVRGWAQHGEASDEPVILEILQDGLVIGEVMANHYRPDLRAAGLGSGCHGFEYPIKSPNSWSSFEVRRTVDRFYLPFSGATAATTAIKSA